MQKVIDCGEKGKVVDVSLSCDDRTLDHQPDDDFKNDHGEASPPLNESAEHLKVQGNDQLKSGNFKEAIDLYSKAIEIQPGNHIYYANRSAAFGAKNVWAKAEEDAKMCVELEGSYIKGYFRLATAQMQLGQLKKALTTCKQGLVVDPGNKELIRLAHKVKSSAASASSAANSRKSKKNASLLKNAQLYEDLTQETPGARMLRKLKEGLTKGGDQRDFEGIFSKLMDKSTFQKMIFPGLSDEQRAFAPQSFESLLSDPMYAGELESIMPKTQERADSVLQNVKKKGADIGQFMDPATEERLRPQILQEAFAREVLAMVSRVHRAGHARVADSLENLADPEDERATWDQLDPEVVEALTDPETAFAVQDDFLGEEWPALLYEDAVRFMASGQMTPIPVAEREREGVHGEIAFVEPSQLEESYPALAELIKNLHALPFELRSKVPSLNLMSPLPGSTAVVCMEPDCLQRKRLDCGTGSEYTGYKYTCVYFFSPFDNENMANRGSSSANKEAPNARGSFILEHIHSQEKHTVDPASDRLIIFDSRNMFNEREKVQSSLEKSRHFKQFSVTFWIHGSREHNHTEKNYQS